LEEKQNSIENINIEAKSLSVNNISENTSKNLVLNANEIFESDKEKFFSTGYQKGEDQEIKISKEEIERNIKEQEDFLNESINSQNMDQIENKMNEFLDNNPDIKNAIKNGNSEDENEENIDSSSSSENDYENEGEKTNQNGTPKNNKIIFADDNNDIQISDVPINSNNNRCANHNNINEDGKVPSEEATELINKIINSDKHYETTEKIKINLDSEVFQSKRFPNGNTNIEYTNEDINNLNNLINQQNTNNMTSSPYHINNQNLSNYQDYFMSNYAHFFFRGRDSSIHREYFALKCLEQQKPELINNHLIEFENRLLVPLYQRINISMSKKKKMYYYTYTKYRNIIYKVLYNDKVLSKVEPYGSYVNNFLIDSGDIDICIVPKCSFIEFNIYLERIKEFIVEKVF
jgi:hypothetical protein